MTIYQYDDVAGTSISFNPATDQLAFSSGISAAGLFITSAGTDVAVSDNVQGFVVLLGTSYSQLVTDSFVFADGSKFLIGTAGNNTLTGSAQADYFDASTGGSDVLSGQDGDDQFILGAGLDSTDQVSGGNGYDTAHISGSYAGTITLGASTITGIELFSIETSGPVSLTLHDGMFSGGLTSVQIVTNEPATLNLNGSSVVSGSIVASGTSGTDVLIGGALGDFLDAGGGNDLLNGGAEGDTLIGGAGDDTYVVDNASDGVQENASEGTDLVQSSITYTLGADLENLTLTGSSAINGTGNALNNVLTGNSGANTLSGGDGNDTINGGTGNDTMAGGIGNDTYTVDSASDTVTEAGSEGTDLVQSSVTFTLGSNVENLTLTGTGATSGTGNVLDNVLTGNIGANTLNGGDGNDTLDGGANADTMVGGLGGDTYVVTGTGDVVTENFGSGNDTVQASISYTLGVNVENLTLTGTAAINATGNSVNNNVTGNTGNNVLDGSTGNDVMSGGTGDDTYVVDSSLDSVVESGGAGTDLVLSGVSFTLGSTLENLTLTGTAINGTGNALNNVLTGNSGNNTLNGGGGSDTLDGGAGNDTLVGGAANDTYTVDSAADVVTEVAAEGTDLVQASVTYTLGAEVDNLTLTGAAAINATGNTTNNVLTGNSGNNLLAGGAGNDTMAGGANADSYVVDSALDVVTENFGSGNDTVQASISYTLGANLENLSLTGTAAINATGNTASNNVTGNSGNNLIDGGTGNDVMSGGDGDDTFVVDSSLDSVGGDTGTDLVQASVTFTLGSTVENLILTGSAAINGTGNALNNVLTGNSGNNTLDGGAGNDTMAGGAGNDTYVVSSSLDVITENFGEGSDFVQSSVSFTLGSNVEDMVLMGGGAINGTGNSLVNVLIGSSGNNILDGAAGSDMMSGSLGDDTYIVDSTFETITEAVDEGTDQVQSSATFTLGNNFENLTLTGVAAINGAGNGLDNVLTGNDGINQLAGGAGNDTYVVNTDGDLAVEDTGNGLDQVLSSVSFTLGANVEQLTLTGIANLNATGNELDNTLVGNSGNNSLNGGNGVDTMSGGAGDDIYIVGTDGDGVTEDSGAGIDRVNSRVSFVLGDNIENLTLTGAAVIDGTGNGLVNTLIGNGAGNTLDGGADADTMRGAAGNDTYIVDDSGDSAIEGVGRGIDQVLSGVSFTLGANLENLTLTGSDAIDGTGNGLDNVMTGNSGINHFNGGAGNDTYILDTIGDRGFEAIGKGIDEIISSVSYTLGVNIERLTLSGGDAINGTGNALDNLLTGNGSDNVLVGGAGKDTLVGGIGADVFALLSAADSAADTLRDIISDFSSADGDTVDLSALDANTATGGDDAFSFIGGAAFSAVDATGQVRFGSGILYGSTDADADAEFSIRLTGVTTLVVSDLVL